VEERDITLEEIGTANEAFITSTTKQILPVYQIDNITFEKPEISLHLQELLTSSIQVA
jgi:branched-chain amino acid aminotransferase